MRGIFEVGSLLLRIIRLLSIVFCLMVWAAPALAANACSSSIGKVSLNEYNFQEGFTEVKKLDTSVNMTGWKVTVYTSKTTTSGSLPASGANSCFGGVYQVNQFAGTDISQNADVVLFDNNNDVVDMLRVRTKSNFPVTTAFYSSPPACSYISPPNDLLVSSSNKGVDRLPDGTGSWRNTPGTGSGSFQSRCESNDGGGNASPGATLDAVEVGAAAGMPIRTRIAATGFPLDILARDTAGAIATGYNKTVTIELVDASSSASCGSMTLLHSVGTYTFTGSGGGMDNGRKTYAFNYANVAKNVRVRLKDNGSPAITACSTDNFAIRPASLGSMTVSDTDSVTAGTARTLYNTAASGGNVHKAGRPFRVAATAFNSVGAATTSYNGSPAATLTACLLPGSACTLGTLNPGTWTAAFGVVVSTTATYSEAGAFTMKWVDTSFADVDLADSSTAERYVESAAFNVGRFVPDHFVLTTASMPQFKTFNDTTCFTRSFTYMGQPFGYLTLPQSTITAKNAAGGTTTNYAGALWKLPTSPPNTQIYTAPPPNSLDTGLIGLPVVISTGAGVGSLTANAADVVAFTRTTPIAPFMAAISLSVSIVDSAENAVSGNGLINTASPALFSSMAFDSGNEIRFGQLVLTNAHGAELLDLPAPIEAQFWNGSGFTRNAADACTQLAANQVTLSGWQRDLNACETSVTLSGRFIAGRGKLKLSKPGAGNTGSVDLKLNLNLTAIASGSTCIGGVPTAAAGASKTWLQGRWTGVGYDQNPAARASFGLYRGGKSLIYLREMY